MKLKNTQEKIVKRTDPDTGEITEEIQSTSKTFNTKVKAEEFFIVFLESIGHLIGIKSGVDRAVLDALCAVAEFDTGVVHLTSKMREKICELTELKYQTVANSLSFLRKNKFIIMDKGECKINPEYFWKGSLEERSKILREGCLELRINFGNKTNKNE